MYLLINCFQYAGSTFVICMLKDNSNKISIAVVNAIKRSVIAEVKNLFEA